MKGVTFLPGAVIASLSIGAIVAMAGMVIALAADGGRIGSIVAAAFVIFFAIPVGFVGSILPNFVGAALLAWLGRDNIAVRLPVMWALAGAGAGAALVALVSGGTADLGSMALLAMVGTVSALLCRWKTVWNDDERTREASDGQAPTHPARAVARSGGHAADRWLH